MRIFINENFYDVTKEFVGIHIDIMNYIDKKYGISKMMNDFADSYKKLTKLLDISAPEIKELKDKFSADITKAFSHIEEYSFVIMMDTYGDIDSVKKQYPFTWKMLMEKWNNKDGHGKHYEMGFTILYTHETNGNGGSWSDYFKTLKIYFDVDFVDHIIYSLSVGNYYESLFYSFKRSTVVHELRHAYDSFQSNYKYRSDKRSENYYNKLSSLKMNRPDNDTYKIIKKELDKIYYILPHEYWARLSEYVLHHESILSADDFNYVLKNAMDNSYLKLSKIPKKEQRKIINKLKSINIRLFKAKLLEKLYNINSPDGFFSLFYKNKNIFSYKEIYKNLKQLFYDFKYFNKEEMDFLRKSFLDFKKKYKQQKNI